MDLAKYISFLHTSSIRLARADTLKDPYEGLYNEPTIEAMRNITPGTPRPYDEARRFAIRVEEDKQSTFVNCWHWSDEESAAMWDLYSNNDYCISVVSDGPELMRQLPSHVAFTFVKYIDWDTECFEPAAMSQSPYFHKRKEYAHEKEVRVIYMQPLHEQLGGPKLDQKEMGLLLPVEIQSLIKEVVLAPKTPAWVADMVAALTREFNFELDIRTSTLLDPPR